MKTDCEKRGNCNTCVYNGAKDCKCNYKRMTDSPKEHTPITREEILDALKDGRVSCIVN